jgi:hypothetical protein
MARTTTEKRMSIEEQIKNLEKQRRQLLYRERAEEREEHDRRLQRWGKYVENLIDGAAEMTDEQFHDIVENAFNRQNDSEKTRTL